MTETYTLEEMKQATLKAGKSAPNIYPVLEALNVAFPDLTFRCGNWYSEVNVLDDANNVQVYVNGDDVGFIGLNTSYDHWKNTRKVNGYIIEGKYVNEGRYRRYENCYRFMRKDKDQFINAVIEGNWLRKANPMEVFEAECNTLMKEYLEAIRPIREDFAKFEDDMKSRWGELLLASIKPGTYGIGGIEADVKKLPQMFREGDAVIFKYRYKWEELQEQHQQFRDWYHFGDLQKYDFLRNLL
jgi:hypothetical protein